MYDEIKNHLLIVDNIEVRGFSILSPKIQPQLSRFKCMSSKESVLFLKECFRFSNIKLSI